MKLCIFTAHEKYEFYFDYSQRMNEIPTSIAKSTDLYRNIDERIYRIVLIRFC